MGFYVLIRPQDDALSQQASTWAGELLKAAAMAAHTLVDDCDGSRPADQAEVLRSVALQADLVFYFGHGTLDAWLTDAQQTVNCTNAGAIRGKAVVAVACKTGSVLAGAAITAGVTAYLGFTIAVPVLPPHRNVDPIGDAFVSALSDLGAGATMQDIRDRVASAFDQLVRDYDTGGKFSGRPDSVVGYYASMALRDHVVLHGSTSLAPLP